MGTGFKPSTLPAVVKGYRAASRVGFPRSPRWYSGDQGQVEQRKGRADGFPEEFAVRRGPAQAGTKPARRWATAEGAPALRGEPRPHPCSLKPLPQPSFLPSPRQPSGTPRPKEEWPQLRAQAPSACPVFPCGRQAGRQAGLGSLFYSYKSRQKAACRPTI